MNRDAGNLAALERPAYRFGLIAVEAGKTGPKKCPIALGDHCLGERVSLVEQADGDLFGKTL